MVVPYVHQPSLDSLDAPIRTEFIELISRSTVILRTVYNPAGFNLGANIGTAAGAGIADHFHMHVVPRWGGDTNFMSTISGTRVLSEALGETYERVRAAWIAS